MNPWSILQIEPTDDLTLIKRTYAKKLKISHPEDDPEEYQVLREAYDAALTYAKTSPSEEESGLFPDETITTFLMDIQRIYDNYPSRMNVTVWDTVLHSELLWDLQAKETISEALLAFFDRHYFLTSKVWDLMVRTFGWHQQWNENQEQFQNTYPKIYAYACLKTPESTLAYEPVLMAEIPDADLFLKAREEAYLALKGDAWIQAEEWLNKAAGYFDGDTDLSHMFIHHYCSREQYDLALEACDHIAKLLTVPNEVDFYRAKIHTEKKDWNAALDSLENILLRTPDDVQALSLAGYAAHQANDLQRAKKFYVRLLTLQPKRIEAILAMSQVNDLMLRNREKNQVSEVRLTQRLKDELGKISFKLRLKSAATFLLRKRWL
ncbi:tetratricopeptide (TPR) repeat protein [Paenibacillus shirakamiensis]|uniref:Tetratricopeptide (TPR) repeat protein n=1 Tax=Paenibacillus shirakamiensis TaxID=1265935 RepID=A0ABS4JII4_9BACL|nr:hypothetical protein [Paenibacillus shirakamiensis]MBP2001502.1 tetratricopeptide (TPR) repeat protein [Paenibacillus shirakamiensis]